MSSQSSDRGGTGTSGLSNFVGGTYVATTDGATAMLIDPSTGEEYLASPVSGAKDVDAAMDAAAAAFPGWRDATPSERSLALFRIADALEARADDLVAVECANTGKPVAVTLAEEIPRWSTRSASSPGPPAISRASRPVSTWPTTPPSSVGSRSACVPR